MADGSLKRLIKCLTVFLATSESRQSVVLVENVADDFRCTKNFVLRVILFLVFNTPLGQYPFPIDMPYSFHLFMMISLRSFIMVMMMMLQSVGVIIVLFSIFYDIFKPEWVLFNL